MTCANYNKGLEDKPATGFTLDRSINISTLIYALVLVIGGVLWFARLEGQVGIHASQIKTIQESQSELKTDLVARLTRIEDAVSNTRRSK